MATYNPDLITDRPRTTTAGPATAGVYTGAMTTPTTAAPTTTTVAPTPTTVAPKPNVLPAAPAPTTMTPPTVTTGVTGPALVNPHSTVPGGTLAAPNILPAAPTVPGTGAVTQPFGPGNDLRFTQVTPGASPLTNQANSAIGSAMQALTNGPDRAQLARSMFDTFEHGTQGAYNHALTDATRMAAANGRLGSGMLTNQYGDLANQRQTQLDTAKDTFMQNALQGTIQDRLNNLGALGGMQNQLYGQDAAGRGELRDERGYQSGQSQYADQQAIQLRMLEEQLLNGAFGRQNTQTQTLGQFGFGGSPTQALQNGANYYGQQGAAGTAGFSDALSQYLYQQALQGSR